MTKEFAYGLIIRADFLYRHYFRTDRVLFSMAGEADMICTWEHIKPRGAMMPNIGLKFQTAQDFLNHVHDYYDEIDADFDEDLEAERRMKHPHFHREMSVLMTTVLNAKGLCDDEALLLEGRMAIYEWTLGMATTFDPPLELNLDSDTNRILLTSIILNFAYYDDINEVCEDRRMVDSSVELIDGRYDLATEILSEINRDPITLKNPKYLFYLYRRA